MSIAVELPVVSLYSPKHFEQLAVETSFHSIFYRSVHCHCLPVGLYYILCPSEISTARCQQDSSMKLLSFLLNKCSPRVYTSMSPFNMILDLVTKVLNIILDLWSYLWVADAPHFEALFSIPIISNVLITRSPVNDLFWKEPKCCSMAF